MTTTPFPVVSLLALLALTTACGQPKDEREPKTPTPGQSDGTKAVGRWLSLTAKTAPTARTGHTAVWSGTQVLIFGGEGEDGRLALGGGVFKPAGAQWRPLGGTAPAGRVQHTAVWTTSGMTVWGGTVINHDTGDWVPTASGGTYLPQTGAWEPTQVGTTTPSARYGHAAVSTGTDMIVWGGIDTAATATGALFQPATGRWESLTEAGAPSARFGHTAVWTGSKMIVWGGISDRLEQSGAVYDPKKKTWTPLAVKNAPAARKGHSAVWVQDKMLVFGGQGAASDGTPIFLNSGGIYDLATDTWSAMSDKGAPAARTDAVAAATDRGLIVYGGNADGILGNGGAYDLATNTWTAVAGLPNNSKRFGAAGVWTGTSFFVWGGRDVDGDVLNDGGSFTLPKK